MPHSGLQLQVLGLYRTFLRTVRTKPEGSRARFKEAIREGFKKQARAVGPREVSVVEHLLRRGRAQLETLKSPNVTDINPTR